MRRSENGNGAHPAIMPTVITVAAMIVVGFVGWVVGNYLTIREHIEYKANQEAASRENRQNIEKLREKYDELLWDMIREQRRSAPVK